jgi:DNA-damage-inducible protein D
MLKTSLVSFESQNIRKIWHEERWFFSIIDVVEALTDSDRPRKYWNDLKTKLSEEGSDIELSGKIGQLKLLASDGKKYLTDCADTRETHQIILHFNF